MGKLNNTIFYTLEKSIKVYRKFAQSQIIKHGYDVTIDQWLVLKTLQENQNLSQNQIAVLVFKDFASITRIIELLVKKKYLERLVNENDRRKSEFKITNEGRKIIEKIYPIVIEYRAKALNGFEIEEINTLKNQLEKFIKNCNELI